MFRATLIRFWLVLIFTANTTTTTTTTVQAQRTAHDTLHDVKHFAGDAAVIAGSSLMTWGLYLPYKLLGVVRRCRQPDLQAGGPHVCQQQDGCEWTRGACRAADPGWKGGFGFVRLYRDRDLRCLATFPNRHHKVDCQRSRSCRWSHSKDRCVVRALQLFRNARHDVHDVVKVESADDKARLEQMRRGYRPSLYEAYDPANSVYDPTPRPAPPHRPEHAPHRPEHTVAAAGAAAAAAAGGFYLRPTTTVPSSSTVPVVQPATTTMTMITATATSALAVVPTATIALVPVVAPSTTPVWPSVATVKPSRPTTIVLTTMPSSRTRPTSTPTTDYPSASARREYPYPSASDYPFPAARFMPSGFRAPAPAPAPTTASDTIQMHDLRAAAAAIQQPSSRHRQQPSYAGPQ